MDLDRPMTELWDVMFALPSSSLPGDPIQPIPMDQPR